MVIYSYHMNGADTMNYRTEQKEAFIIAGYTQEMKKIEQDENFYEISNVWSNLTEEKINQLMAVTDGTLQGLLGVSDSNKSQRQYRYMIGMNKKQDQTTLDELAETQFPATKWVIFECIGAISAGVKALDKDQPFEPNVLMRLKQNTHAPWQMGKFVKILRYQGSSVIQLETWKQMIISVNCGFLS